MDGINTITSEKMSPPGNEKPSAAKSSYDFGDTSNPRSFETGGARTESSHLLVSRDTEVSAPRNDPRQILERGIRRAFFCTTDDLDDGAWAGVRAKLLTMTLGEARGIWQTIANGVAVECFDGNGKVDVERLQTWMTFLGDAETFGEEPFCLVPHAELMRFQMHRICECLASDQNGARTLLNDAASITVGQHGHDILAAMVKAEEPPLNPAVAILASLLVPHRQWDLPTCTINSLINEEIQNHPERLIKMYKQMLSRSQFHFPSEYAVKQQPIVNGFITVDLKKGPARDKVFEDIKSGNRTRIDNRIARWREEGIEYAESADEAEKYKLRMPVGNMNDILLIHFFQASYFGNRKIDHNGNYGTMEIYAGHRESSIFPKVIPVDGSNFLDGIKELKEQAKTQLQLGHSYMRVATAAITRATVGDNYFRHSENVYIPALLALNPDTMEFGKAYLIGERNWDALDVSQDIPRLAVRKLDGTPPTYEFGTLRNGSAFAITKILKFRIYSTEIKKFTPPSFFTHTLFKFLLVLSICLLLLYRLFYNFPCVGRNPLGTSGWY